MAIVVNLDVMMAKRKISLRFNALEAICKALDCRPGDRLGFVNDETKE